MARRPKSAERPRAASRDGQDVLRSSSSAGSVTSSTSRASILTSSASSSACSSRGSRSSMRVRMDESVTDNEGKGKPKKRCAQCKVAQRAYQKASAIPGVGALLSAPQPCPHAVPPPKPKRKRPPRESVIKKLESLKNVDCYATDMDAPATDGGLAPDNRQAAATSSACGPRAGGGGGGVKGSSAKPAERGQRTDAPSARAPAQAPRERAPAGLRAPSSSSSSILGGFNPLLTIFGCVQSADDEGANSWVEPEDPDAAMRREREKRQQDVAAAAAAAAYAPRTVEQPNGGRARAGAADAREGGPSVKSRADDDERKRSAKVSPSSVGVTAAAAVTVGGRTAGPTGAPPAYSGQAAWDRPPAAVASAFRHAAASTAASAAAVSALTNAAAVNSARHAAAGASGRPAAAGQSADDKIRAAAAVTTAAAAVVAKSKSVEAAAGRAGRAGQAAPSDSLGLAAADVNGDRSRTAGGGSGAPASHGHHPRAGGVTARVVGTHATAGPSPEQAAAADASAAARSAGGRQAPASGENRPAAYGALISAAGAFATAKRERWATGHHTFGDASAAAKCGGYHTFSSARPPPPEEPAPGCQLAARAADEVARELLTADRAGRAHHASSASRQRLPTGGGAGGASTSTTADAATAGESARTAKETGSAARDQRGPGTATPAKAGQVAASQRPMAARGAVAASQSVSAAARPGGADVNGKPLPDNEAYMAHGRQGPLSAQARASPPDNSSSAAAMADEQRAGAHNADIYSDERSFAGGKGAYRDERSRAGGFGVYKDGQSRSGAVDAHERSRGSGVGAYSDELAAAGGAGSYSDKGSRAAGTGVYGGVGAYCDERTPASADAYSGEQQRPDAFMGHSDDAQRRGISHGSGSASDGGKTERGTAAAVARYGLFEATCDIRRQTAAAGAITATPGAAAGARDDRGAMPSAAQAAARKAAAGHTAGGKLDRVQAIAAHAAVAGQPKVPESPAIGYATPVAGGSYRHQAPGSEQWCGAAAGVRHSGRPETALAARQIQANEAYQQTPGASDRRPMRPPNAARGTPTLAATKLAEASAPAAGGPQNWSSANAGGLRPAADASRTHGKGAEQASDDEEDDEDTDGSEQSEDGPTYSG